MSRIHEAVCDMMAEVSAIGKNGENTGQHYAYRKIEDVYNNVSPLLVKHRVFSHSVILDKVREERGTAKGGVLIYTQLTMRYVFSADDGSEVSTEVVGEGMDSGDKSSNKAMAAAHKYALCQLLSIPYGDAVDPEQDSHDVKPKAESGNQPSGQQSAPRSYPKRECPKCHKTEAVRKSTTPGQTGFYCWRKKGGCGNKWPDPRDQQYLPGDEPPVDELPDSAQSAMSAYSKATAFILNAPTEGDLERIAHRITETNDQFTAAQIAALDTMLQERKKVLTASAAA